MGTILFLKKNKKFDYEFYKTTIFRHLSDKYQREDVENLEIPYFLKAAEEVAVLEKMGLVKYFFRKLKRGGFCD